MPIANSLGFCPKSKEVAEVESFTEANSQSFESFVETNTEITGETASEFVAEMG